MEKDSDSVGNPEPPDEKIRDLEYPGPIPYTLYSAVARRYLAETPDKHKVLMLPTTGGGYARGPDDVLQMKHKSLDLYPFESNPNLPSSEILEAIHYFFASRLRPESRPANRGMYDETSLIAMGIMLEELVKDALGPVGHLLYATEREDNSSNDEDRNSP